MGDGMVDQWAAVMEAVKAVQSADWLVAQTAGYMVARRASVVVEKRVV